MLSDTMGFVPCSTFSCITHHEFAILRAMNTRPENEDIDFEPEDEMGVLGATKAKMQKLRDELEKVKAERQEYLDGWQRAKADAVNVRKDAMAQGDRQAERRIEAFVEDLLPALDSFDMATATEAWSQIDDGWRSGMENVQNQLLEAMKRNGVERFAKIGDAYDPRLHDVVQELPDAPGDSGSIVRILRYGYKLGERIIRPAQVIIKPHG